MLVKDEVSCSSNCFLILDTDNQIDHHNQDQTFPVYVVPYGTNEYFGHSTVVSIHSAIDAACYFEDVGKIRLQLSPHLPSITVQDAVSNGFIDPSTL